MHTEALIHFTSRLIGKKKKIGSPVYHMLQYFTIIILHRMRFAVDGKINFVQLLEWTFL